MRTISHIRQVSETAMVLVGLVISFMVGGVAEAQELNFLNRDIVLLDCVENANGFAVQRISTTRDVGISQGLDCAAAIQRLLATGFVMGQETGGVTSSEPTSLNHFLMVFIFNSNALLEPTLEKSEPLVPTINRNEPLTPIFPRPEPLSPIIQSPQPLSPILQRRNP